MLFWILEGDQMQQLLPQDVLLAVRLLNAPQSWSFESAGALVGISASQCHAAFGRLCRAELVEKKLRMPIRGNLLEFLIHGVKYAFPVELGPSVTGIPTAHSAPIWKGRIIAPKKSDLVWEHPTGKSEGTSVEPLYKTVPIVSLQHQKTYGILALLDSLRVGKAREHKEAATLLTELIYNE